MIAGVLGTLLVIVVVLAHRRVGRLNKAIRSLESASCVDRFACEAAENNWHVFANKYDAQSKILKQLQEGEKLQSAAIEALNAQKAALADELVEAKRAKIAAERTLDQIRRDLPVLAVSDQAGVVEPLPSGKWIYSRDSSERGDVSATLPAVEQPSVQV